MESAGASWGPGGQLALAARSRDSTKDAGSIPSGLGTGCPRVGWFVWERLPLEIFRLVTRASGTQGVGGGEYVVFPFSLS